MKTLLVIYSDFENVVKITMIGRILTLLVWSGIIYLLYLAYRTLRIYIKKNNNSSVITIFFIFLSILTSALTI